MSMNKKKLPKAISGTAAHIHQVAAGHGESAHQEAPRHHAAPDLPADGRMASHAFEGNIVAVIPSPKPVARVPASRAPTQTEFNAVRRLSRAHAIVERHVTYSAAGGLIPLPIVNVASVMAIIVRMVKTLSRLYGVPFEHDRARAIVVGLAGGTMPTGLAAVTTSTLHYLIPASALLGLVVSSVTAVACTRSIGRIFVDHFESGATLHDLSVIERR
jgi:uncharacterized protein (DUF697 family)